MTNDEQTTTTEPTGWKPEPGDILEGEVASLDSGWSDYQDASYPIVTIKRDDGSLVNVHCFHAVLRRRMMALAPAIGDKVKITYHGKRQSRDEKREVAVYTVESDRPQNAASFWGGMGGESRARPEQGGGTTDPDVPIADDDIPF